MMEEGLVSFEDFKKLKLRVAQIKEVSDHPNADRLYVVKIDTGTSLKTIVAGIKKSYSKEELIGKKVVIIENLQPAVIRGVESQAMLLAASSEDMQSVLTPAKDMPVGSSISCVPFLSLSYSHHFAYFFLQLLFTNILMASLPLN